MNKRLVSGVEIKRRVSDSGLSGRNLAATGVDQDKIFKRSLWSQCWSISYFLNAPSQFYLILLFVLAAPKEFFDLTGKFEGKIDC